MSCPTWIDTTSFWFSFFANSSRFILMVKFRCKLDSPLWYPGGGKKEVEDGMEEMEEEDEIPGDH